MLRRGPAGIRGQYESFDPKTGLWHVHKNIFTLAGWTAILGCAFHGNDFDWEVGLCNAVPQSTLLLANIEEPTSTGGYERQALSQGDTDWPEIGTVEGEAFVRSKEFTFPFTSGAYSNPVTRLFLIDGDDNVLSVSSAFPAPVTYTEASTHRYRLYFR